MPLYAISYTVAGKSRFPLDMLRYDGSHPATQGDVELLDDARQPEGPIIPAVGITLRHVTSTPKWLPTTGRWQSFGWQLVPGSVRVQRL